VIFRSVCSGIEAATVAWHPLGWRADAFAEIEPFPSALLAHHYPNTPNLGDMTKYRDWPDATFDVLVGGTPCQSFSVAGLRKGLADPRGNLALVYLGILDRYRPRWMVWENVPGVLSSWSDDPDSPAQDDGHGYEIAKQRNDFDCFLGGLAQLGYGFAYRVLDAQYIRVDGFARAVPQRRRRVFVVGYLGDWRRAAAVLFERDSLSGHSAPRREAGQGTAPTLSTRTKGGGGLGTDFDCDGGLVSLNDLGGVSHALTAKHSATGRYDPNGETFVAHSLRGGGFDASEDGTGRGTPIVPVAQGVALRGRDEGATAELTGDVMTALRTGGGGGDKPHVLAPTIAYRTTGNDGAYETGDVSACMNTASDPNQITLLQNWRVRRLTPVECERLMGFPDDYTAIPYRGKIAADGPRYKALGNSMAVNCMRWIGRRIEMVEAIISEAAE